MSHPTPKDVKVVRADQLRPGILIYVANGWHGKPEETNGCFRQIESVEKVSETSERDLKVVLGLDVMEGKGSPGKRYDEPRKLVEWYDNHTLVMVHKNANI